MGNPASAEAPCEFWPTRLISGMVVRLSQPGQTATTSRSAIRRSSSNLVWQALHRYS